MKRHRLFLFIVLLLITQTYALQGKIYLDNSFKKIIALAKIKFSYSGYEPRPLDFDTDPWFRGNINSCKSATAKGAISNFRKFIRYDLIRTNELDQILTHFFKMESSYWICEENWILGDHTGRVRRFFLGKEGNIRFALTKPCLISNV